MILSPHAKSMIGRWFDALHPARADAFALEAAVTKGASVAVRTVSTLKSVDDGTGTWLAAGLIDVHDEVNVEGLWFEVTGTDVTKPAGNGPGRTVLYFDGRWVPVDYMASVYVRDAAAIIGAQIRGGAR